MVHPGTDQRLADSSAQLSADEVQKIASHRGEKLNGKLTVGVASCEKREKRVPILLCFMIDKELFELITNNDERPVDFACHASEIVRCALIMSPAEITAPLAFLDCGSQWVAVRTTKDGNKALLP